ncbi:hypothetical protein SAMN05421505_14919 [Sinosporangium album]|uniref:Terminase small subunit n=1 Tax=Sinosporangium album TaxID=504805 RepID=A0A1G8KBJ2_9ACTN|nr:hypothetical protein [Sinosporangium album]SDI40772.1 hypothetical protein SAMN05421505_14919 [Sinosporangium album]
MGERGPVPKRSDQRRRTNKPADAARGEVTTAPAGKTVAIPAANPRWHALAKEWYASLAESGQSTFYEASDWATAKVWAELLSRELRKRSRVSAQMIAAWAGGATELLTTEGARRRMRVELQRGGESDEDEEAAVVALDAYQARLSG